MISAASQNTSEMDDNEKKYLLDLSEVFLGFGQGRIKQVRTMITTIVTFLATHHLDNPRHDTAWRATLEALVSTLLDNANSTDNSTPFGFGIRYRLRFVKDNLSLNNTQLRFAIQLAIIVGFSFAVSEVMRLYFDTQFGPWIPITSFLMMNTYRDDTLYIMRKQLLGMAIGMVVFIVAVHFIPSSVRVLIVLILSYSIILMNFGPTISMAAGTQMALTALYPSMTLGDTLMIRLLFVLLGAVVVVCVIYAFLKTRRQMAIAHKIQEMQRVDERLLVQLRSDIDEGITRNGRSLQLLYYLHMNAYMLTKLAPKVSQEVEEEVRHLTEANYDFAMEAARAVVFLNSEVKNVHPEHIDNATQKLRIKIDDLPVSNVAEATEEEK